MEEQPLADLIAELAAQDLEQVLAAHPQPALVVEPFTLSDPVGGLTQRLDPTRLTAEGQLTASFKRRPEQFLHPEARCLWLVPGPEAFVPGLLSLGRSERCDLILHQARVSGVHALLHQRGEEWWLEDWGSANGTYRNGQRLPAFERARLADRDQLRFGDAVQGTFLRPHSLCRLASLVQRMSAQSAPEA